MSWWELTQSGSLLLAILTAGLHAGVYFAFSVAVMPGLRRADDATFVITVRVNIPLNDALEAADPTVDPGPVRASFEPTWVRWNAVRAALSTASLGALASALALIG